MAITTAVPVPYHTMQIILYACLFTSFTWLTDSTQRFSQNDRVHVQQVQTVRVIKYACFLGTQNKRAVYEK
jgi:hypothetical protein